MDGVDIPALVRRARLVKGLTQAQLAEEYDVHPTTVGRWETGKLSPAPSILCDLYQALVMAHPVWSREFIDASPVPRYIHHIDDLSLGILVSDGMVTVFGSSKKNLLANWLKFSGPIIPELYREAKAHPNFKNCHHIEVIFPYYQAPDLWWHGRGIIMEDARSVLWEGSILPKGGKPSVKVVTKDEVAANLQLPTLLGSKKS